MTSELRFGDMGWGQQVVIGLEFAKGGAWVSLAPAAAPLGLASRPRGVETAGATASQRAAQLLGACGQTTSFVLITLIAPLGAGIYRSSAARVAIRLRSPFVSGITAVKSS